jgi:hypothetical protein
MGALYEGDHRVTNWTYNLPIDKRSRLMLASRAAAGLTRTTGNGF